MKIVFTRTALKQLEAMDAKAAKKILVKIDCYAADPKSLANQIKKLKGSEASRLRVGDYRVIFTADSIILTIIKVGHRRDVYH